MNLPFQKIHSAELGYGYLVLPSFKKDRWGKQQWLFIRKGKIHITGFNGFHNCTKTGIY